VCSISEGGDHSPQGEEKKEDLGSLGCAFFKEREGGGTLELFIAREEKEGRKKGKE